MGLFSKLWPKKLSKKYIEWKQFENGVRFKKVSFRKPTVDYASFTKLERIVDQSWSTSYYFDQAYSGVLAEIRSIIQIEKALDKDFILTDIDSMCASSSFSYCGTSKDASSLPNVKAWSERLYEAKWMGYSTDKHFEENEWHALTNGVIRNRTLNIYHYNWHKLNVWMNSGGSHHTAALIRQMNDQNRTLDFKAIFTILSLDSTKVHHLSSDHFIFIAEKFVAADDNNDYSTTLAHHLKKFTNYWAKTAFDTQSGLQIFVIPKTSIREDISDMFVEWLANCIQRGEVVDFFSLIENPQAYLGANI